MKQLFLLLILSLYSLSSIGQERTEQQIRDELDSTFLLQVGVREATGKNDGPEVEMYLASCGLGKGFAWCGAQMNWGFLENDLVPPKSAAWSPSWFPNDKVIYKKGKSLTGKPPQKSDVMGIYFASKKRIAHVGHVHRWPPDSDYTITIEGNTNGAGSREGDGVYKKRRLKRQLWIADWVSHQSG
ncbi:hypothetical protein [Persicobacter sp. CCB-QB2]|uniref:hypothetical protein n=1 Tax=Persicobacter sp. CCB-QB2 TaxID=1561025 RepID=UPI0006A9EB82|nr:hypothetical protein [Persicobacter sp. CCB-QB2]